jgi:thiol-disulfide isomerase/thioredoxin
MANKLSKLSVLVVVGLSVTASGRLHAANPTVAEALAFQPVQKDVQFDKPDGAEIAKCTIKAEKIAGKVGWVVRDGTGQMLRNFVDTNADNAVDQWSYYKDGVEVYRDIDSNFNRKVDQCRWLNTAGTRWGLDVNEDTKIDQWKSISAEEVTAELVAAIRDHDRARFEHVLLNPKEIKLLGVGKGKADLLAERIETALGSFPKIVTAQKLVTPGTKWVSFAGNQPGLVPAGTDDSTADLNVYENVMAMIETDGKPQAISVGAIVRVKDTWRLIDVPQMSESTAEHESRPFFFPVPRSERPDQNVVAKPNEKMQKLMDELQKMGEITPASTPEELTRRCELIEEIAVEAEPEGKNNWYRQLADTLSASVQAGNFPDGIDRLKKLSDRYRTELKDEGLAFYAEFRYLTAEHGQALSQPGNFANVQAKWITDLKAFVEAAKKYPDSADAMMELAIAEEFGGSEDEAVQWYDTLAKDYPDSPLHRKAEGAKLRLTSIGKQIPLQGKLVTGQNFDIAQLKNKVVLVQYWATWCEPCKSDMPLLKDLRAKFKNFEVVGVCLDNDKSAMTSFLKENDPHWPQLFEDGGLESRFAVSLGIQTLPTMYLIDKQGKVVSRNIRGEGLETELKKLLK